MYLIWAEVWGGVTGAREGYLKHNGAVVQFETREAAEKEAARLNKEMNNERSKAAFRYTVIG